MNVILSLLLCAPGLTIILPTGETVQGKVVYRVGFEVRVVEQLFVDGFEQ